MPHVKENSRYYGYFKNLAFNHYDTLSSFMPSFKPFNKIFRSIVYSKIGTEIAAANRAENFIRDIANDIIESQKSGLYLGLALVQLADDIDTLGIWIDDDDDYNNFHRQMIDNGCRLLSSLLLLSKENLSCLKINDHVVYLPEFLCLLILSFYQPSNTKVWTTEIELDRNIIIYPNNNPIERIFVPEFRSSRVPQSWQDGSKFFNYPPNFITRYKAKISYFKKKGARPIILMPLTSKDMKKEWIVTVFINNNLELFGRKNKKLYHRFVRKNLIRTSLVKYQNELCVTFSFDTYNNIKEFCDFEAANFKPAQAFIASSLGLYLRMLWRIDPSLEIPLTKGYFYSYHCNVHHVENYTPQGLFHALMPTPANDKNIFYPSEQSLVENINAMIIRFMLYNNWIDDGGLLPRKYDGDKLLEFFEILKISANDEAFIETGAKFIAKIFQIPFKFIKFEKSMQQMKENYFKRWVIRK